MISKVLEILWVDEHYGAGELTERAKGKYERITSVTQGIKQMRRCLKK